MLFSLTNTGRKQAVGKLTSCTLCVVTLGMWVVCACEATAVTAAAHVAASGLSVQKRERPEQALRNGDYELAEKLYREKVTKNGRDTTARLGLSFALLKRRSLQDAFDQAVRVATLDPTSARAHALLGSALLAAGDFSSAVDEFRVALSLRETEALAIAGLGMVDFYENRLAASISGLRRAISLDSKEPDYVFNLAQAAARAERYREAADAYERFLVVSPRTDEDRRARIRGLIDFLRYLGTQRSLYQVSGVPRVTLPFELTNNRPVVRIHVNGSTEPLRFVVDTGSGMCVLSDTAAKRLGLRPVARGGAARAVGGGGRFDILYGFVPLLEFGGARIENVPVYIRQFYNTQETIDGYIGLSLMSKYLTAVDYGARTITFSRRTEALAPVAPPPPPPLLSLSPPLPSSTTADNSASAASTTLSSAAPVVVELPARTTSSGFWSSEVRLAGINKPLNFIIDTGASISVVSTDLATREEMERFAQSSRLRVYGAAGVAENVQSLALPNVLLGSHVRPNVNAVVLDMSSINETTGFEQTGILGGNVLRHFRVTFDFMRAVIRLEPLATSSAMPPTAPLTTPVKPTAKAAPPPPPPSSSPPLPQQQQP